MEPSWKWILCVCLLLCSSQNIQTEKITGTREAVAASAQENVRSSQLPERRLTGQQQGPGIASSSASFFVNPNALNLLLGDRQRLQLLDAGGIVVPDVTWSVVDPSVAETVPGEDGLSTLVMAKAVGQTKIIAASGAHSAYAELTVFSSGSRPNGILRWAAAPLPGSRQDLSSIVQSVRVDDKTPELYVGDGARVRAFDQDGQQHWVWPVDGAPKSVQLLAGDDRGDAVALVSDRIDDSVICIDWKGHQAWVHHLTPPFKLSDYAIDQTGVVYLLEDQPQGPSQVVALEPDTGQLRFTISVPVSVKGGIN
jgi:outer membrane protein assembly factor BamB